MKIKIEGKAHLKGISKRTNLPYDFIQVHYLGVDRQVIGKAAKTLNLDVQSHNYDGIAVGAEYNVEFDDNRNVVGFDPVPAK